MTEFQSAEELFQAVRDLIAGSGPQVTPRPPPS